MFDWFGVIKVHYILSLVGRESDAIWESCLKNAWWPDTSIERTFVLNLSESHYHHCVESVIVLMGWGDH